MLGVQPVEDAAYEAVVLLGKKGGWEGIVPGPKKAKKKAVKQELDGEDGVEQADEEAITATKKAKKQSTAAPKSRKRKEVGNGDPEEAKPVVTADEALDEVDVRKKPVQAARRGRKRKGDEGEGSKAEAKETTGNVSQETKPTRRKRKGQ